jgi:uncharacterized membrane protein
MPTCPNCGAALDGGPCSRCQPGPVIADNIASALCYLLLGVTGLLLLFIEPYRHNRRVRFHAFQAILLNLVIIVFWVVISLAGRHVALLLSPLFMLGCMVLWLALIWTAWQDSRLVLPVIGPMAEKQA